MLFRSGWRWFASADLLPTRRWPEPALRAAGWRVASAGIYPARRRSEPALRPAGWWRVASASVCPATRWPEPTLRPARQRRPAIPAPLPARRWLIDAECPSLAFVRAAHSAEERNTEQPVAGSSPHFAMRCEMLVVVAIDAVMSARGEPGLCPGGAGLSIAPASTPSHQRRQADSRSYAIAHCVRPLVRAKRTASSSNSLVNRCCCVIEFLMRHWELSIFTKQVQPALEPQFSLTGPSSASSAGPHPSHRPSGCCKML